MGAFVFVFICVHAESSVPSHFYNGKKQSNQKLGIETGVKNMFVRFREKLENLKLNVENWGGGENGTKVDCLKNDFSDIFANSKHEFHFRGFF